MDVEEAVFLTEKGWWGNGPVAAGYHNADARLNKRHREVDDFRTLLIDGEGANGHVSSSIHDLREEKRTIKQKHWRSTVRHWQMVRMQFKNMLPRI